MQVEIMQVLVSTDNHIDGSQQLEQHVESVLADSMSRFGERIVRVEVHLGDENSRAKAGDRDKRCSMEARLAGLPPLAVTHQAASLEEAIDGAVEKLTRVVDSKLGRLNDSKGRMSYGGDQTI
jgi:ribosome-associated translation inhibitor RaiA